MKPKITVKYENREWKATAELSINGRLYHGTNGRACVACPNSAAINAAAYAIEAYKTDVLSTIKVEVNVVA